MKTLFILTYYILTSTRITNVDFIEYKRVECQSFDAALATYNKAMRESYTISPEIKKIELKDSLVIVDTLKNNLETTK